VRLQHDTLVRGQSQNLVVIHHRVHIFNPQGIDITVENEVSLFILSMWEGLVALSVNI
jgi:hypothetical protein